MALPVGASVVVEQAVVTVSSITKLKTVAREAIQRRLR